MSISKRLFVARLKALMAAVEKATYVRGTSPDLQAAYDQAARLLQRCESPSARRRRLATIKRLRKERDRLWKEFNRLPRRSSFSGLSLSKKLDTLQQVLDKLEGDRPSKRYEWTINVEVG